jgi:hypothetical protein
MAPCTIQHEKELFAAPGADRLGTLGEGDRQGRNGHGGEQQPPGPTGTRAHKSIAIAPLVAMVHDRRGALSAGAPDAAEDGLEPDAVLVGGPQLDLLLGVRLLQGVRHGREGFLKATRAAGSAFAWRGRGTLTVQPRRRNASHPHWRCTRRPNVAAIQAAALGPSRRRHRLRAAGGHQPVRHAARRITVAEPQGCGGGGLPAPRAIAGSSAGRWCESC